MSEVLEKFKPSITNVMAVLQDPNDNVYVRGEYLGYFINRCVLRYLGEPEYTQNSFNSAHFSETKRKTLQNSADSVAAGLTRTDPIGETEHLFDALAACVWGYLDLSPGMGNLDYVDGTIDRIKSNIIHKHTTGSQRDVTMAFRRHLIIRGVLNRLLNESFRRYGAPHFDRLASGK